MNRRIYPALLGCTAAILLLSAGCGSKDTGTTVTYDPAKSQATQQAEYERVKNDPKIPAAQKQMILARIQGAAKLGESGKTAAEQDPAKKK